MKRHNVSLSEPVSETVKTQVKSGRYKDFSAAVQDALWNYFLGSPSPFEQYNVTPEEVELLKVSFARNTYRIAKTWEHYQEKAKLVGML